MKKFKFILDFEIEARDINSAIRKLQKIENDEFCRVVNLSGVYEVIK